MSITRNAPVTRDVADEYERRASLHRPTDADGLRIAALDLACAGLREADIARALSISIEAARQLLRTSEARS